MSYSVCPTAAIRAILVTGMSDNGHILVVDDQQEICALLRDYLTDEGFRVTTARDGDGLREILACTPVNLVILDQMLPGEDGLALARELRGQSEIGIIILSGRGETIDRIIGLEDDPQNPSLIKPA